VFLLPAFIVCPTRPSKDIQVVTYGASKVYDVQYFPRTNLVYYSRYAWESLVRGPSLRRLLKFSLIL
jgi:hypothetical protein